MAVAHTGKGPDMTEQADNESNVESPEVNARAIAGAIAAAGDLPPEAWAKIRRLLPPVSAGPKVEDLDTEHDIESGSDRVLPPLPAEVQARFRERATEDAGVVFPNAYEHPQRSMPPRKPLRHETRRSPERPPT